MIELNLENIDFLYITSDLHLNHKNIIKYCNRPWEYSDKGLEEMNHILISNLMEIPARSTLLNLGDWAMLSHGNTNRFMIQNVIADLLKKGVSVITILGNHDRIFVKHEGEKKVDGEKLNGIFLQQNEATGAKSVWYSGLEPVLLNGRYILSHEPVFIENKDMFNLHGHIHNSSLHHEEESNKNVNMKLLENYINCCADVHDFMPFMLEFNIMSEDRKKIVLTDMAISILLRYFS